MIITITVIIFISIIAFDLSMVLIIICIIILVPSLMLKEPLYNLAETLLDKKQKSFMCPRCKIPVNGKTKICERCGNKI